MGNYLAIPTHKKKNVCGGCLAPAILDRDELAIHKEVGVPKGSLCLTAMKYLDHKERSLMIASASNNSEKIQLLIKSGAPADTYDENRTSPLHIACRQGSIQVVKELLEHRAAIDITDCAGWTSLHIAAYSCRPDIVKMLLEHNADATIVNRNGETPWDLAADASTQQEFIQYWKGKSDEYESPRASIAPKTLYDITAKKAFPRPVSPMAEKHKKASKRWEHVGEYREVSVGNTENLLKKALKIFNKNPFKGLAVVVLAKAVQQTPENIAIFLFKSNLHQSKLGLLLSDNDVYYQQIASEFMSIFRFNKSNLMLSLRKLFRSVKLPIEKMQRNNLVKCFAREFWDSDSLFKSFESVENLCFSIIMLDFSLHDPTSSPLSKNEFVTSTAGMHDGEDFSEKYLSWVFEDVKHKSLQSKSEEKVENIFESDGYAGHLAYKGSRDWKERFFVLNNEFLWSSHSNIAPTPYSFISLSGLAVHFDTRLQTFTISNILPFPHIKLSENGLVYRQMPSRLYFKAGNLHMWLEAFQTIPSIKLTIV